MADQPNRDRDEPQRPGTDEEQIRGIANEDDDDFEDTDDLDEDEDEDEGSV